MKRFNAHSDDIDYRTKTQAILESCIARRQWHNVATLGGFKSEHDARVAHDPRYVDAFKAPQPVASAASAEPLSVKQAMKFQAPPPARVRSDQAWVADIRRQMDELDLTASELSTMMGFERYYVASMLAPTGSRGPTARDRLEHTLRGLYVLRAAQGEAA